MAKDVLKILAEAETGWVPPELEEQIPHGDMPGDKIVIGTSHIEKGKVIFPRLAGLLRQTLSGRTPLRAVVTVCGGSGVGKSETASLLAFYLQKLGVGCYVLSGDNYPRRIPAQNDAERLRVFRTGGIRGLLTENLYTAACAKTLMELQKQEVDADPAQTAAHPWLAAYQKAARDALAGYLGSTQEQNFDELTQIVAQFKRGDEHIWLKRMGRTETELWYDDVDFSDVQVLIIEWTHGNSDKYQGVDIPVLLNSTPEETREHRRQRNRDGKTDSAFTTAVLELEQKMLEANACRAKIIVAKNGDILCYAAYRQLMAAETERGVIG